MMRSTRWLPVLLAGFGAVLALAACGDNSNECGYGTTDIDGVCTAGSGSAGDCGSGTVFDPGHGQCIPDGSTACGSGTILQGSACVIDPSACQDGTVLVGDACLDPGRVSVDLEEGAEPNGLGVLVEPSTAPAGTIALKAIGSGAFVLHGHLTPFEDSDGDGALDGDSDGYLVTVTQPTALKISVDGLGGIEGGFVAVAAAGVPASLQHYQRLGVNLTGSTATRELFLPAPGTYVLEIADTRDLVFAAADPYGGSNSEYYASIEQIELPSPTAIPLTAGSGSASATDDLATLQTFSFTPGSGITEITATDEGAHLQDLAFAVLNADGSYDTSAESGADLFVAGFSGSDSAILVIDPIDDVSTVPQPYEIDIRAGTATALSTTGGAVSQAETEDQNPFFSPDLPSANDFTFDAAADGDILGISLVSSQSVEGVVFDASLSVVSFFTAEDGDETFKTYKGFFRAPHAGRYYLVVDDPTGNPSRTITITSTITKVAPAARDTGTLGPCEPTQTTFGSFVCTYAVDGANAPWVSFIGTPNVKLVAFDDGTAFGRLDPVTTATSSGASTEAADPSPLFTTTQTAAQTTGRVELPDAGKTYLLVVTPPSSSSPNVEIAERAPYTDLGELTAGGSAAVGSDQTLAPGGTQRYLVETDPGSFVKLTITSAAPIAGLTIHDLDATEHVVGTVTGGATSTTTTASFAAKTGGFLAFTVTGGALGGTYTISADVVPEIGYAVSNAPSSFATICTGGGTDLALASGDPDDGLTAAQPVPSGFLFFGETVTSYVISTNGWLSFQPAFDSANTNADIPGAGAPNALIAPFWTDLTNVEICKRTTGAVTTIEWKGREYNGGLTVDVQAQLNGATNAITFVYGPSQQDLGSGATVGLEDFTATLFSKVGFDTDHSVSTSMATIFSPM